METSPGMAQPMATAQRSLTYGEQAVGINFNPANDPNVQKVKELYAEIIDLMMTFNRESETTQEMETLKVEAIRQAQTAQMWAVKGITYQY